MVKYYAYQDNEYDISKSINSLSDLYSTENIISLPEKSYILRVPFIQKYSGVALVLSSSVRVTGFSIENSRKIERSAAQEAPSGTALYFLQFLLFFPRFFFNVWKRLKHVSGGDD